MKCLSMLFYAFECILDMFEKTILPKNGLDMIVNILLLFSQLQVNFSDFPPPLQAMIEHRLSATAFQCNNHPHLKSKLRQLQALQFVTKQRDSDHCESRVAQLIEEILEDRVPTLNVALRKTLQVKGERKKYHNHREVNNSK